MTKPPEVSLVVRGITKRFGQLCALHDVSFQLMRGETVSVIGDSGSGKSTLLRCLNLLEWIDDGSIEYVGTAKVVVNQSRLRAVKEGSDTPVDVGVVETTIRRRFGFVFQGFNLWDDATVLRNLTLAPRVVFKEARHAVEARARELCARLGIGEKLNSRVWQLSGGQRQRVAIARALMMRPEILLLDEATSALDPTLIFEVMQMIKDLRTTGMTMVLVTHHLAFASRISDRLIFLHAGNLLQDAPPSEMLANPATAEVARYLDMLSAIR